MIVYLDSSALVKLVVEEAESAPLREAIGALKSLASSALARVEVGRAAHAVGVDAAHAESLFDTVSLIPVDDEIIEGALSVQPATVRSLDAVHIATAQSLGDQLGALITYDARMRAAAEQVSVVTLAPR